MNNPKLYKKVNNIHHSDATQLLERFSDMIKWRNDGGDSVLDIGCGTGDVTSNILGSILPKSFKYLKGIDKSPEMVQYANTHYKSSKVSFEQWDVSGEVDKKMAEQFDHVFSFYTLHWVQDQKRAFQNIYDLLKPGGDCLVMFLADHVFFSLYKLQMANPKFMEVSKDTANAISPYSNRNDADIILKKLVQSIGFKNVFVQVEEKSYTFYGAENFKDLVKAVHPPLTKLSDDLQNEMIEEFFNACSSNSPNEFVTPYKLITFYGIKN